MQTVDRGGVHIDQCQACRGIFLDRGELEQILNAEQRYQQQYAAPPPAAAPPPMYRGDSAPPYRHGGGHGGYKDSAPPYGYGHRGDSPPPYGGHGGHGYGHKRKRKSFLEELFD